MVKVLLVRELVPYWSSTGRGGGASNGSRGSAVGAGLPPVEAAGAASSFSSSSSSSAAVRRWRRHYCCEPLVRYRSDR